MTIPGDAARAGRSTPEPAAQIPPQMTPERWRAMRAVVQAALERPPGARPAFVAEACGADAALRADVDALLAVPDIDPGTGGTLARRALIGALARVTGATGRSDDAGGDTDAAAKLAAALAGRYAIERELGRGGMATVYLARDLRHKRDVAVKVLHPELAAVLGPERFLREIELTASLQHPHILPLHDSGEAAGRLYYVMPYVDGETLRARLARAGPLPLAEAVRLLREVADALAYAHGRGIVHRDVKPANILLQGGHALVADFGIGRAVRRAREAPAAETGGLDGALAAGSGAEPAAGLGASRGVDTLTGVGMLPGTPAYMAPEQARGAALVDHRADLYALGVVAYEALAGAHPFGARAPQVLLAAHRDETPPPLAARRPEVPPALAALVSRLLAKDPAARPESATAVLGALDDVPAASAATAANGRRVVLAAAAALLVAAGVGGFARWRGPGAPNERREAGAEADLTGAARNPTVRGAIRTVAVLPFVNTGSAAADEYFSDGLTDELARALGRLPGLRLAGRVSSDAFRGEAGAAQDVGRALSVDALLRGTVRRGDGRLRVTVQLVRAADGAVLWDSVYEHRSGDVFAVQDAVTRAVVAALTPTLGADGAAPSTTLAGTPASMSAADVRRGTADQEAYDLYLKGRYFWLQRGADNVARAIVYYGEAVARDPAFARAHAGLAMAYGVLPLFVPDPADSAAALTMASAERAVALDSTLADAQLALGTALDMRLRFRDAFARYRAALALDPSSVTGHHWLGMSLLNLGRTGAALAELRHASELDPLAPTPATAVATGLLFARRFPEAATASRRALALDSSFAFAIWSLGLAQALDGQPDSAVRTLERGVRLHPHDSRLAAALVFADVAAGRWADAERVRLRLRRPGGDRTGGAEAAVAELVLGDREPLVRLLTTARGQRRYIDADLLGCNPLLDPLWADARFRRAMRRLSVEPCPLARPWPVPPRPGA